MELSRDLSLWGQKLWWEGGETGRTIFVLSFRTMGLHAQTLKGVDTAEV